MDHFVQAVSIRWFNACAYYAVALSKGLKKLGYNVTFTGTENSPAVERAKSYGIEVIGNNPGKAGSSSNKIRTIKKYRRFIRENNVKLVNVHDGYEHILWSIALRGTGIPLIRTSGNQIPPKVHFFSRMLINRCTLGIITSCKRIRDYYSVGFGIDTEKIPVINGGIDTEYYAADATNGSLRDEIGFTEKDFVFGIIARFSPDKGHEYFFQAAGIVAKEFPQAKFIVAGWKAQRTLEDIQTMAREAGVFDKTVFLGRLKDSRDIIKSIDAGVIASINSETICRIAMEYMAMGVPCIAAATNVIPEVIRDNESGYIVPSRNSEAMADAMKQLIIPKDKAKILGCKAREIAEKHNSLESFAAQTIEAYGSIIGNG